MGDSMFSYPGCKVASIGSGRFGSVDCYRRHEDEKLVAVKSYHNSTESLLLEYAVLHKLARLPYICQLASNAPCNSVKCLEMELYPGGPLHKHIQQSYQSGMYVGIALAYMSQLVSALLYLEAAGVIHRDIKTSNCILDHLGNIKLCDFGSSRCLFNDSGDDSPLQHRSTRAASVKTFTITGTAHSMAPEMAAASLGYDQSVDYWSLGVVAYELLTGRCPPWDRSALSPSTTRSRPSSAMNPPPTGTGEEGRALGSFSWPTKEDSAIAAQAINMCRTPRLGDANIGEGSGVPSIDSESTQCKRGWFIEVVDTPFTLKRGGGSAGGGGGYGLTERERRQYGSAVDLVRSLLTVDPTLRLCSLCSATPVPASSSSEMLEAEVQSTTSWGAALRRHPAFAGVDWAAVDNGNSPSPNPDFDRRLGCMELLREHDDPRERITDAQQDLFAGF